MTELTDYEWSVKVLVAQSCLTLCDPRNVAPGLLCTWDSPGKNTGLLFPSPGDFCDPGIEPRCPALQMILSSPSELPGNEWTVGHS